MKTFLQKLGSALDSRGFVLVIAVVGVTAATTRLLGQKRAKLPVPAAHESADVVRGEYLVRGVGLCADCHSQRNADGKFDESTWLLGAAIPFKPTIEMPAWAEVAVPIAGLPTIPTDEEAVAFLMEGKRADGRVPRPPMPEFRMDRRDAQDVVAYLRSLNRKAHQK